MAATVSKRLSNSFEGALAGGGDPATSPLYVFGPFLKLVVLAGVAHVTFGATVWLAVFTVIMVSAMYRQVMTWVTDGSGGSGLAEEEFGSWAVKVNAGITVIEYTLTFLVSMAALVTFIADRLPVLNASIFGFQYRTFLAVALSLLTAWMVNLGPRVSARAFGPATAAILGLLWLMIFATIYQTGFHLPSIDLKAFSLSTVSFVENGANLTSSYLNLTLGGYARILALMTGIEIFANLVAAYDGNRGERSRKAFGSLIIIMGTTALTMLIVGPAILAMSDATNEHVSVFTQTMDKLLPSWGSYAGTIIGVAVLLSACAAAAQGIQNLMLGLRYRHYVPASFGQRNKHDVASLPVWLMVVVIAVCFVLFGTNEETFLALYAAGVFILLSMTGWAASKRLFRELDRKRFSGYFSLFGTIIAALLTSGATFIIFEERFFEGAWSYLLLVPILYVVFHIFRKRLGPPPSVEDRLGSLICEQRYLPLVLQGDSDRLIAFDTIVVPLNGSSIAEQVIPTARSFARSFGADLEFIAATNKSKLDRSELDAYLELVTSLIKDDGLPAKYSIRDGSAAAEINAFAQEKEADLIIMTTRGKFTVDGLINDSIAKQVLKKTLIPTLLIRPTDNWRSRRSNFKNILIALDGSEEAEAVLPYIRAFSRQFESKVQLLSVPEGSESDEFRATITQYLDDIASALQEDGVDVQTQVTGSGPVRTILSIAASEGIDMIMMTSHGRAGTDRDLHLGSVTEKVVQETNCPVFIVPLTESDSQ